MARGTTGAPRNTASSTAEASEQGALGTAPDGVRGGPGRLARIVCGRRSKYLVVAFWILVIAAAGEAGLSGYVTRPTANAAAGMKILPPGGSTLAYATLAVAVVLLLAYRSPVLWLLPVISAGAALTVAEAVINWLTQHANLTMTGQSDGILAVLVIGTGTDYALLLVARYREELRHHADRHAAMAVALRRAGPAIMASGLTVVAGMLCLLAAEPDGISGLGPVAAAGIAAGLIATVTLLPALLVMPGRWIFWPARPAAAEDTVAGRGQPGHGPADGVRDGGIRRPWREVTAGRRRARAQAARRLAGHRAAARRRGGRSGRRRVRARHLADPGHRPAHMVAKLTVPRVR